MTREKFIGEAYLCDGDIVIASYSGIGLPESHNCDAMGCCSWHVIARYPASAEVIEGSAGMSARPEPPPREHDGFRWEAVPDEGWLCPAIGSGRCRWIEGERSCGRHAVATLLRGTTRKPWDYCERHLYGRWLEGGRIMHWRLVQDTPGDA